MNKIGILIRAVGGITGKGSKTVNPVYQNQFTNKKGLETLENISNKAKAKKAAQAAQDANDSWYVPPVPGMKSQGHFWTGFIPNPSGTVKVKNVYTRSK